MLTLATQEHFPRDAKVVRGGTVASLCFWSWEGGTSLLSLWRLSHVHTTGTTVAGAYSTPNKELSARLGLVLLMGHAGLWDGVLGNLCSSTLITTGGRRPRAGAPKGSVRLHRNTKVSVFKGGWGRHKPPPGEAGGALSPPLCPLS